MACHVGDGLACSLVQVGGEGASAAHRRGLATGFIAKAPDQRFVAQPMGGDSALARRDAEFFHHIVETAQVALQVMPRIAQVRILTFRHHTGVVEGGQAGCTVQRHKP